METPLVIGIGLSVAAVFVGIFYWYTTTRQGAKPALTGSAAALVSATGATPTRMSADGTAVFFEHKDIWGYDITSVGGGKTEDQLLQILNSTPGAVAINTAGYVKNTIDPSHYKDESAFAGAGQGLWVSLK